MFGKVCAPVTHKRYRDRAPEMIYGIESVFMQRTTQPNQRKTKSLKQTNPAGCGRRRGERNSRAPGGRGQSEVCMFSCARKIFERVFFYI